MRGELARWEIVLGWITRSEHRRDNVSEAVDVGLQLPRPRSYRRGRVLPACMLQFPASPIRERVARTDGFSQESPGLRWSSGFPERAPSQRPQQGIVVRLRSGTHSIDHASEYFSAQFVRLGLLGCFSKTGIGLDGLVG